MELPVFIMDRKMERLCTGCFLIFQQFIVVVYIYYLIFFGFNPFFSGFYFVFEICNSKLKRLNSGTDIAVQVVADSVKLPGGNAIFDKILIFKGNGFTAGTNTVFKQRTLDMAVPVSHIIKSVIKGPSGIQVRQVRQ